MPLQMRSVDGTALLGRRPQGERSHQRQYVPSPVPPHSPNLDTLPTSTLDHCRRFKTRFAAY